MWSDVLSVGTDWTMMRVEHGMNCPPMLRETESRLDSSLAQSGVDVRGLNKALGHTPAYAQRSGPPIGKVIGIAAIVLIVVVLLASALG